MTSHVAVVDHGLCNLDSVYRALEECGASPYVTCDPTELSSADRIVLPGVGAFARAMERLRNRRLDVALTNEVLDRGAPFLGICLGMQLLATRGHENGTTPGLGWIDADVLRLQPTSGERVPHMGWNEVRPVGRADLFRGIAPDSDFYFVHSYHVVPRESDLVAATTPYCDRFVAAVQQDHIFAVQFHPEKSQRAGFQLLRNFLSV